MADRFFDRVADEGSDEEEEVDEETGEVRRSRANGANGNIDDSSEEDEEEWRSQTLELLTSAHSLGGIIDLNFEIVESRNAVSIGHSPDTRLWPHPVYKNIRILPSRLEMTNSNGDGRHIIWDRRYGNSLKPSLSINGSMSRCPQRCSHSNSLCPLLA